MEVVFVTRFPSNYGFSMNHCISRIFLSVKSYMQSGAELATIMMMTERRK